MAVVGIERVRNGSRVSFVCGGRALRAIREYRDLVTDSLRTLSVTAGELPQAIDRTQRELQDLRRAVQDLEETNAGYLATRLLAEAPLVDGCRTVVQIVERRDAAGLRTMASALTAEGHARVVLVSRSSPAFVVVARSGDAPGDGHALLKTLIARFGGKGGGRPQLAQGGGLSAEPEAIAAAARDLLS